MQSALKENIEYILPRGILRLLMLAKIYLSNSRSPKLFSYMPNNIDKIVILGNGPSLTESINKYFDKIKQIKIMAVNQFATTDYYTKLKPDYYVLADPDYYEKKIKNNNVLKTVEAIEGNTSWQMIIFASEKVADSELYKRIRLRSNITFVFYSKTRARYDLLKKRDIFRLLKKDLIEPPSQTVLNTCMAICIFYRFNQVYLIGADTSWHEQYMIDQKTNDLYINERHYYGNEIILYKRYSEMGSNLAEEFSNISKALSYYQILKEYADNMSVSIYNSSEKSWIDVFKRRKLE